MSEYLAYKADLPGSRRAPCLGCGQRVVTARDPHVVFAGKRDGSLLVMVDAEPQLALATDPDRIFTEPDLELLGVAHRACANVTRQRLEAQEVELSDVRLPIIVSDDGDDPPELPALHLPPAVGTCPFCGREDTTDEHVWPKWISRELATLGLARPINITVPVCKRCNERWLSVLENDVAPILRPMIRGRATSISA